MESNAASTCLPSPNDKVIGLVCVRPLVCAKCEMQCVNEPCRLGTNFAYVQCSLQIVVASELQFSSHDE